MDDAFARLRSHARNHNEGLTAVATSVVAGELAVRLFTLATPPKN